MAIMVLSDCSASRDRAAEIMDLYIYRSMAKTVLLLFLCSIGESFVLSMV